MYIPFNKPYFSGLETKYIKQAIANGKISGDGLFTEKCHHFFENRYNFKKAFLTTSCTDALEMASILCNIQTGDEVIAPAFTFVSTVNAFVLRGAKIIFVDSSAEHPNINVNLLESLITPKTKVIIPVHYAGVACDMDKILELAEKYNLIVVEDAAQAINSFYKEKPLGSFGTFATFSFHETKNIISGEGGLLVVNDADYISRAEIIREKGTNRSKFFRGEIDKYSWVDIGSSFLPSDIIAAFLYAQLEKLEKIQIKRKKLWETYYSGLIPLAEKGVFQLPFIPKNTTNNFHIFYLLCNNIKQRNSLIDYLKNKGINAVFHYLSLHKSPFYQNEYDGREMPNSDRYSDCLLRLPMFYELSSSEIEYIISMINKWFSEN